MTGKTHIAVGLATVVVSGHLIQPSEVESFYHLTTLPQKEVVIQLLATILVVWLGSLAPDLDQPGSTLSRDLGGVFGRTRASALVGGLGLLYLSSHMPAIIKSVPFIQVGFVSLGCLLVMMAMLKHRGLTHSLLGMVVVGVAVHWGLLMLLDKGFEFAPNLLVPFLIGYGMHLVADSFTNNGIAPFYLPFVEKTQGHWHFPLCIRTGYIMDTVVVRLSALIIIITTVIR